MPKDINFSYSFHTIETGDQTVTATVTRGNIPVAPEPIYVDIEAQGFTLPDLGHPDLDPTKTEIYYETTWKKDGSPIVGAYPHPQSLSVNDSSYIRGSRFMWCFDEPGTYTATVNAVNMHDHSEIATTTLGPFVVQDYVDYFTSDDDFFFYIVSADDDTTGIPAAVLAHTNVVAMSSLASAVGNLRRRSFTEHSCILVKNGEETAERVLATADVAPNVYIRTWTGNQGSARHKLSGQSYARLEFKDTLPDGISVQVQGLEFTNNSDSLNEEASLVNGSKGISINADSNLFAAFSDILFNECQTGFQGTDVSTDTGKAVFHNCFFTGSLVCDVLGGVGDFIQFTGTKTRPKDGQPSTVEGLDGGWSVRIKDNYNIWMSEINGWRAHGDNDRGALDWVQGALRVGDTWVGATGSIAYIGASTVNGTVYAENTGGGQNASKPEMMVIDGSRVNMNSVKRFDYTILNFSVCGVKVYNTIFGVGSGRSHLSPDSTDIGNARVGVMHPGDDYNSAGSNGDPTIDGYRYGDGVMDGLITAQFNTSISLDQEGNLTDDMFIGDWKTINSDATTTGTRFRNIVDENNLLYAPFQNTSETRYPIDRSQFGSLEYVVRPYWSHAFTPIPASGISDQMITVSGVVGGFTEGATLTQGGVSAEIWVIQLDSIAGETRIWLGPQTGGTFVSGAIADDVSGSGTVVGNQEYGGTMIDGTPDTPVAAVNKTWVPPVDHYGNPRSFGTAIKGAVEKL